MTGRAAQQCHLPPAGFRGTYRADALSRAVYSEAAGVGRIVPVAIAVPRDAEDVMTLVRWASASSLSIVPRGSGTSMSGGAIGPGVMVDLSGMDSIGEVDVAGRSVWVGPGALRGKVNRAATAGGLRFPVDPSSGEFCTIGGMVSTNAAGAHTLGFGAMRRWVLALDCVFDDGSRAVIERGRPAPAEIPAIQRFLSRESELLSDDAAGATVHAGVAKNSSGYGVAAYAKSRELVDLLVGSEGTLAVIVGVKLALTEAARATSGVLGAFGNLDDAVKGAVGAREAGAVACELLDRTFLDVAAGGGAHSPVAALASVPPGTEAVLLAEVEGESEESAALAADELARLFAGAGASVTRVALGSQDQHEIWELRHAASPILSRLDPALKSMQFIEDSAVPANCLADYVRGVRAALDARGVRGVIFGHAGDAHVHVNPLIDVSKLDWRADVDGLLDDIVALTARLGGTLSGEHGDGRLRTPLLSRVWSSKAIELFALVKRAFDPRGILNSGVKVPVGAQRPLGDIKYDPALAPLPAEARLVLDKIADDSSYATPRLSLIPGAG
ncbi:MAG: FAD-binding oxidoreductase [Gemmatimonadaceae bacterium]|nr:FAD-binding oxidoreductase [Gemmatimonadaceae bacterium]